MVRLSPREPLVRQARGQEVDDFLDFTDGGGGLFLITSNVTGVEVPPKTSAPPTAT